MAAGMVAASLAGGARRSVGVWALHSRAAMAAAPTCRSALLALAPAPSLFSLSANNLALLSPSRLVSACSAFRPLAAPHGDGSHPSAAHCNRDAPTPPADSGGCGGGGARQPPGGGKDKEKDKAKAAQTQAALDKGKAIVLKYGAILVKFLMNVCRLILQMIRHFVAKVLPLIREKFPVYKRIVVTKAKDFEYFLLEKACKLKEKRQLQRSEMKSVTSQTSEMKSVTPQTNSLAEKGEEKEKEGPHQCKQ